MLILGIDPGLGVTGYALVSLTRGKPTLQEAGVLRMKSAGKAALSERLAELYLHLADLIAESAPDRVAVEQLYAHYKHPRTAILMGHAARHSSGGGERVGSDESGEHDGEADGDGERTRIEVTGAACGGGTVQVGETAGAAGCGGCDCDCMDAGDADAAQSAGVVGSEGNLDNGWLGFLA